MVLTEGVGTIAKHRLAFQFISLSDVDISDAVVTFAWPAEVRIAERERHLQTGESGFGFTAGSLATDSAFHPRINREFPVGICVSSDQDEAPLLKDQWLAAVDAVLDIIDASICQIALNDRGSWLKRMLAITLDKTTEEDLQDKIRVLTKAAEDVVLLKSEAPLNAEHLKVADKMLSQIGTRKQAVVLIGTLLIIKQDDKESGLTVIVRRLRPDQLSRLERNPAWLKDPDALLLALSEDPSSNSSSRSLTGNSAASPTLMISGMISEASFSPFGSGAFLTVGTSIDETVPEIRTSSSAPENAEGNTDTPNLPNAPSSKRVH